MSKVKSKVKSKKIKSKVVNKKPILVNEPYDRDDMVNIELTDLDGSTFANLKSLMLKGGYGSISEVVRDIFRRAILGDAPPRALPKISTKELSKRLGFK